MAQDLAQRFVYLRLISLATERAAELHLNHAESRFISSKTSSVPCVNVVVEHLLP
jgi:hypothetical protein